MLKKTISLLLLTTLSLAIFAQNTDSITFVKTKWQKNRVAKKVKLFRHHFDQKNLFAANQNISFIEVRPASRNTFFAVGAEEKELVTVSQFGERDSALAGLNGNFFDVKNGGSVDFVRLNGKIINQNRLEKDGQRAKHQKAAVVIDKGKIEIKKWDGTADWEIKLAEPDVMLNGPLLTFDGVNEAIDTSGFSRLRHPRTCLGVKPNGNVVLLTVDGRNEQSEGLNLLELTKIMNWLGCKSAINFDGGGSTTLWVKGFEPDEVINYPTDNKKWDHEGQRKVANVILVKKK